MLRSLKEIQGYIIRVVDGDIGRVHEFYFDDFDWIIRYLVADTGTWLSSRRVLISPLALGRPDWEERILPVKLSREQVELSPPISVDEPVSRQMERELNLYYGWRPYWDNRVPVRVAEEIEQIVSKPYDPHLRSTKEVLGYHIQASDGEIGHIDDFILDDTIWTIRYLVVDTQNWLPGKKVLVSPAWVDTVEWTEKKIQIDLKRETIKNSPEFDPSQPVNHEYEIRLYDFYGRPKYWQ